ncbi:MAG: hypothetical protein RSB45_03535 [Bacilli bacterium]
MKKKKKHKIPLVKISLSLIGLLILLTTFFYLNKQNNYLAVLKKECLITKKEDINVCLKTNNFVKITFSKFYSTNYIYKINNIPKAAFIDIDIQGTSIIALIDINQANHLLNTGTKQSIRGYLKGFEKQELIDVRDTIINNYISQGKTEEEKELIKAHISNTNLNQYNKIKLNHTIILICYSIIFLFLTILLFKNIYLIINNKFKKS